MSLAKDVEKAFPEETDAELLNIVGYEYGDLLKCDLYARRFPEREDAYRVEGKIAMSDLLTQLRVYCERRGWDLRTVLALGEERLAEKLEHFARDRSVRQ